VVAYPEGMGSAKNRTVIESLYLAKNAEGEQAMQPYNQKDCFVLTITGSQMEVHCSLPDRAGVGSPAIAANDMSAFPPVLLPRSSVPAPISFQGMATPQENPGSSFHDCVENIAQEAETISLQLEELRKITREFADYIRKL
jgi:hypothetical protein